MVKSKSYIMVPAALYQSSSPNVRHLDGDLHRGLSVNEKTCRATQVKKRAKVEHTDQAQHLVEDCGVDDRNNPGLMKLPNQNVQEGSGCGQSLIQSPKVSRAGVRTIQSNKLGVHRDGRLGRWNRLLPAHSLS